MTQKHATKRHIRSIYLVLGTLLTLWFVARIYSAIIFDIRCAGYLKRAADASSIELAARELSHAIAYAENNRYTQGSTAVLWHAPECDVGFWYENLRVALIDLQNAPPTMSVLERTNLLMKLRETLLDAGDKGMSVTIPPEISIFPNNTFYFIWGWSTCLSLMYATFLLYYADGHSIR